MIQFATRTTAFVGLLMWTISWLAPAIVAKSPTGSVFDLVFKPVVRSRRKIIALSWLILVIHFVCACFQTGFLFDGVFAKGLFEVWRIPNGDLHSFAIVVGIPCAAMAAFTISSLGTVVFDPSANDSRTIRGFWNLFIVAPTSILVFFVFLMSYVGQLIVRSLSFSGDIFDLIVLSFYGLSTFILIESLFLFAKFQKSSIPSDSHQEKIE